MHRVEFLRRDLRLASGMNAVDRAVCAGHGVVLFGIFESFEGKGEHAPKKGFVKPLNNALVEMRGQITLKRVVVQNPVQGHHADQQAEIGGIRHQQINR